MDIPQDTKEQTIEKIEKIAGQILWELAVVLPKDVQEVLKNVAFIVEYEATEEQKKCIGGRDLRGLFFGKVMDQPAVIFIFARMILAHANTEEKIKKDVRITILHEIGHYLGMNHKQLGSFGL